MADLSPWEWLARLGPKLIARHDIVQRWEDYYAGDQDLPSGPSQHADAYRRFQELARTNLCRLCVDSMVHRLGVVGFRAGDDGGNDTQIWDLWQQARMDSRQHGLFRRALRSGRAYAIVGRDPRKPGVPRVTIEDPQTVITESDPADSSVTRAALRLWHDSIERRWFATVYTPGARHRYVSTGIYRDSTSGDALSWLETAWTEIKAEAWFDEVPVIEFANADEGDTPRSEFAPGMDIQNRLNLTLMNRLTAERYSAFRQRYLLNFEPDEDEATGLPVPPFNPGADQTFTIPPPEPGQPEPKFGDLSQTDTSAMLRGVEADMRAFAAVTITPVYYLPGDLVNISADSIAALDAGHNAKIKQRQNAWGEQLERLLWFMADIAGINRDLSSSELVWERPENLNLTQVAAYAQTLRNAGYPLPLVAERIGETPQQIEELRAEMAADAMRTAAMTPATPPNAAGQPASGPSQPADAAVQTTNGQSRQ